MVLEHLDAKLVYSAIIHACHNVIAQRESLNAINVFPVADGDTGNNMAATARAIINHATQHAGVRQTCQSIADAGILGARGNSGMIFSQFFNGLLIYTDIPDSLDTATFSTLVSLAVTSVRAAILNPVEGTILTVMDAWADCLKRNTPQITDFHVLMSEGVHTASQALQTTSTTLEVLRQANVVDAGAMGFFLFIQGIAEYLANPVALTHRTHFIDPVILHDDLPVSDTPPVTRYCTEAILHHEQLDKDAITDAIKPFGDSIVLSVNNQVCRLHVHCDEPWRVFTALQPLGKIQYPKVDDMLRQFEIIRRKKHRIALVTDTSANIPQLLADTHQVHLIAFNLHVEGHDLLDHYCVEADDFYGRLPGFSTHPTTSLPAPACIESKLRHLTQHYDEVLVLSVSQALSGTHDAIAKVAQSMDRVHVVNSRQVAGGQGLLVHHAAQLIEQGCDIETIKASLAVKIADTHLIILINQMDALIRSGRINKLKGMFAQFAGMKPLLSLDSQGNIAMVDKAFTETKALVKLIQRAKPDGRTVENYCIVHAGAVEKAKEFAELTTETFGFPPLFIEPVTTAIGLHAGKGGIALGVILKPQ